MDSNDEYLCECFNVATHRCPTHDVYLCLDEIKTHNCKLEVLGGKKSIGGGKGELNDFHLRTQQLKVMTDDLDDFFSQVKSNVNESLESIEKMIQRIKNEAANQVVREPQIVNQNSVQSEVKSIQEFISAVSTMMTDLSNYLKINEQIYKNPSTFSADINQFITKMMETTSVNLGLTNKLNQDYPNPGDDTNFLKMDYSISDNDTTKDKIKRMDDNSVSERVIEITELGQFGKTVPKMGMEESIFAENDDLTFTMDDYDMIHTENFKDKFEESHSQLCRILDQALHDINCPEFYNKGFIQSVNEYFDEFKGVLEVVIKELKNNFNKS